MAEPIGKWNAVEILKFRREAEFERHGERTTLAVLTEKILEALKLIAVFWFEADSGLNAFLPSAVEKKPFLR